jgi:hypothetical protein
MRADGGGPVGVGATAGPTGHEVPHTIAGGLVQFTLPTRSGARGEWTVS